MKQGKSLQNLGRELQRQRNNRQDFIADTRSIQMQSNSLGSSISVTFDKHIQNFTVGDIEHQ